MKNLLDSNLFMTAVYSISGACCFSLGVRYARSVPDVFADLSHSKVVSLHCWREASSDPNKRFCWTINWKDLRDCEAAAWFLTTALPQLTDQGALKPIKSLGLCGPQAQLPDMMKRLDTTIRTEMESMPSIPHESSPTTTIPRV